MPAVCVVVTLLHCTVDNLAFNIFVLYSILLYRNNVLLFTNDSEYPIFFLAETYCFGTWGKIELRMYEYYLLSRKCVSSEYFEREILKATKICVLKGIYSVKINAAVRAFWNGLWRKFWETNHCEHSSKRIDIVIWILVHSMTYLIEISLLKFFLLYFLLVLRESKFKITSNTIYII